MFEFNTTPPARPARQGEPLPTVEAGGVQYDASFWEGIGAGYRMEQIATNSWGQIRQTRGTIFDEIMEQADAVLGAGEVQRRIDESLSQRDPASNDPFPKDPDEARQEIILKAAREANVPMASADLDAEVQARLQREYQDAAETLEFMRGGKWLAGFLGGSAAAITDPVNLALIPFGGGRSAAQIILREAGLGAAGEAAMLPRTNEMADYLEIDRPNPLAQIALGAAGGAIFAGAPMAATAVGRRMIADDFARALEWAKTRNSLQPQVPGLDPVASAEAVNIAQSALEDGRLPDPSEMPSQTRPAEPLVPREPFRLDTATRVEPDITEDPAAPAPAQAEPPPVTLDEALGGVATPARAAEPITTRAVDVPTPQDDMEAERARQVGELTRAAQEARAQQAGGRRPLTDSFRAKRVDETDNSGRKTGNKITQGGIDPESEFAQELKARVGGGRELTRRAPGLLRKGGRKDFDNLVASEWEEDFPGISAAAGVENGYLDLNGLLDVMVRDINGDDQWLASRFAAADLEAQALDLENPTTPLDAYEAMEPVPGGMFVDINGRTFFDSENDWRRKIAEDFEAYLERRGLAPFIDYPERREIVDHLAEYGGEAEYLVERVLDRNLMFLEYKHGTGPEESAGAAAEADAGPGRGAGSPERPDAGGSSDAGPDAGRAGGASNEIVSVRKNADGLKEASGTFTLSHGYSNTKSHGGFVENFVGERYDGGSNEWGNDGVYFDGDGKWTANDPAKMMFSVQSVALVKVTFNNALIVDPIGIEKLSGLIKRNGKLTGKLISEYARKSGHDGVIVTGFDAEMQKHFSGAEIPDVTDFSSEKAKAYSERSREYDKKLEAAGIEDTVAQDQVLAFNKSAVLIVNDGLDPGPLRHPTVSEQLKSSERTTAGDQLLIEGVAPVTDRQRAEAVQSRRMQGGDAEADFGLFDVSGRSQRDLFSDPYSPEADARNATTIEGIREEVEAGLDFSMTISDGQGNSRVMSVRQVIAEMDADAEFAEIANLCGRTTE